MVAERDLFLPKHPELEKIPNLHVIKALQVSQGQVAHLALDTLTHHTLVLS
ncbi:40S ribosomal protein S10 [Portunus trituberculatus]|uniref:40S ribosomal protein S10 n=1 Tax=Portunus trituberculatus TaxID=210409 RepID=A0A5B7K9M6_PORTR|nr:40S ribosomal protein S10 [Portunus trituberculatus]